MVEITRRTFVESKGVGQTHAPVASPLAASVIVPSTGTKLGWRWLRVVDEIGEPYGDAIETDRVRRGVPTLLLYRRHGGR